MDPFTIALAVFGVSKLTGSSTKNALRNAFLAGTGSAAVGAATSAGYLGGSTGALGGIGTGEAFSGITSLLSGTPAVVPGAETGVGVGTGLNTAAATAPDYYGLATNSGTPIASAFDYTAVTPKATNFFDKAANIYGKLDTAEKIGLGAAGVTLAGSLGEDEEPMKRPPGMSDEDYAKAMEEARLQVKDIGRRAPAQTASTTSPYNYGQGSLYTFNKGGIVSVMRKFSQGGINYLPSKITHNENDIHNYVRATGYVEDGSGNGDKDEDTILAQLADGEFVSRSDAVLGAGILSGANPESYKDMRRKGAAYFYDQQAKFKRIFDLIDASKQTN
jgi:hypothetical protein